MDLNQLLDNHQLAKMNAKRSSSDEDRSTYFDLVSYYAKRIEAWRRNAGLPAATWMQNKHG